MTKVLALDQATRTGWCFGGTKIPLPEWQGGSFKAPKRDELGERLLIVFNETKGLLERFEPDLLALEEPFNPVGEIIAMARAGKPVTKAFNADTTNLLQMIRGAVITAAALSGVPTETYPPSTWRVSFLGYGRAPKGAVKDFMKKAAFNRVVALGGHPNNYDEADAYGVCFNACHGKAGIARATEDLFARARAGL